MFAKEQPDLNWENPVVRKKLYEMVNWWLEKGLAGFRIDAIINIKKDLTFSDLDPDGPDGLANCWRMVENVDGVGIFLEDLKKHTFQKYDAFTVGEVFNMKANLQTSSVKMVIFPQSLTSVLTYSVKGNTDGTMPHP